MSQPLLELNLKAKRKPLEQNDTMSQKQWDMLFILQKYELEIQMAKMEASVHDSVYSKYD